jgi:ABC-type transport system involved in multi-copper enzyme maturation permease subunit
MGKGRRDLEENIPVKHPSRWWGLRPWKRHSTILTVVGFLFVLVGISYAFGKPSQNREIALAPLLQVASIQFWGWVFVVAGLLSMLSAKWPPLTETWGYMVLTGLSSGWAATYLTSVIFFHAPTTNYTQVVLWGCLGFMWWAISGLPNPEKMERPNGRR